MKKFLSLLLAFVMLFSLVACGDNPSDSNDGDGKTPVNSGDNQGENFFILPLAAKRRRIYP